MITPVAPLVTSADANALLPGPALCIEVDPAPGPGFPCPPLIHSKHDCMHVNTQVCICIASSQVQGIHPLLQELSWP